MPVVHNWQAINLSTATFSRGAHVVASQILMGTSATPGPLDMSLITKHQTLFICPIRKCSTVFKDIILWSFLLSEYFIDLWGKLVFFSFFFFWGSKKRHFDLWKHCRIEYLTVSMWKYTKLQWAFDDHQFVLFHFGVYILDLKLQVILQILSTGP